MAVRMVTTKELLGMMLGLVVVLGKQKLGLGTRK